MALLAHHGPPAVGPDSPTSVLGRGRWVLRSLGILEYILKNSALAYLHLSVGGTPRGIPYSGLWNGSLWSLVWEAICYLAVAGIGVAGMARHRWISGAILVPAVLGAALLPPLTVPGNWTMAQLAVRSAIMFAAGAVIYQWKDVIPARWPLVAVSVVIVLASPAGCPITGWSPPSRSPTPSSCPVPC